MSSDASDTTPRRSRQATKALGTQARTPARGARFPSKVLGDNLRHLRSLRELRQTDLANLMNKVGFDGWSRVTVSDVERGVRATSVDELFALAIVLNTYVVTLLDPEFSGIQGTGIDLGIRFLAKVKPNRARVFIMPLSGDRWRRDRTPYLYSEFREIIEDIPSAERQTRGK